jgi:WD40 repeat protein
VRSRCAYHYFNPNIIFLSYRFQGFENSSKLCYVIIIEDGPIWSIKFHPSESPLEKRVGLLAVASANSRVLVYSLPYRNDEKAIVLPILPNFICRLKESDTLFSDKYLLQTSRVTWFIKSNGESIIAAGFVSGLLAVWNVSDCSEGEERVYPHHVIQAHLESITALDFKATKSSEYHLVTASLDRKIKVYTFDDFRFQEISSHYAVSRILCAEWWLHWPGFIVGLDDCFTYGSILNRQPLEFGSRNSPLLAVSSSITHFSINHWLNFVMFVSDSGDVLGCQPGQMLQTYPKDKWSYFNFNMFSYTDFNNITADGVEKIGVVFSDFTVSKKC